MPRAMPKSTARCRASLASSRPLLPEASNRSRIKLIADSMQCWLA
jgi:hypothetical protein